MLDVAPAFLPLQPLRASLTTDLPSPLDLNDALSPPRSPLVDAGSCSLDALRASLALPLRIPRRASPRVEFIALASPTREKRVDESEDDLVVRQLKRADVEQVRKLQDACLPIAYPPSFYSVLLSSPSSICLISYSSSHPSTIIGCVAAHISYPPSCSLSSPRQTGPPPPTIYLLTLAVDPSARGRGLAAHLVRSACRALLPSTPFSGTHRHIKVSLHVEATNDTAQRLYRRMGLEERRRQRGFYSRLRGGGSGEAAEMEGFIEV
ncbi:acyl-CoA N-acyltransferase [Rhodotorula diobovata]|uniref:N-alpha-acetyltransferase 60 n=1 Tax=Rhodotorula diobovata TaxID=5288 RepID=A0A5C5G585_9BASI|nr:acyl-CoA N-acyltransferase [Rhodotorula diobovata]